MNTQLLEQAKSRMVDDMLSREYGAIIWSIPDAGFHFIPEIVVTDPKTGENRTARITGLYVYDNKLYAIEEDVAKISVTQFYTPGIDVPPVVVTLSPTKADEVLGVPSPENGLVDDGTLEEWVAIADCYFEALNEK